MEIEISKKGIVLALIAIALVIGLINTASAYYPGETVIFPNELGLENLVYAIIDNSTKITNLDIKINSTNITITFPEDMTPDSFTIILIEEQTKEVIKEIKVGSKGSSKTKYIDRNITITQPEFLDRNITTETEKIVEVPKIEIKETGFKLWHLILGMIIFGILVAGLIIWGYNYE